MSPAARGWARAAAMRSRAGPKGMSASSRGAIRAWSGCRCSRPARCWPAQATPCFRRGTIKGARLAEWLYEAGIGEARAALVEDGRILKARIELDGVRAGTVAAGR